MERVWLQGGAMAVFLLIPLLAPRDREQGLIHPDMIINLLNGLLLFVLVAPLVQVLSARAELGLLDLSALPPWAQFLAAFLALDFTRYWVHRAGHRVPLLWRFHRVHHSLERMDATAGLRMHVVDFLQLSAIPIVLFGVLIDASALAPWAVPAALGVGVFFDAFQHANITFDITKPWWRAWHMVFNNPHFHAWHHTRDGHICDGNYGNTLVWWDRLFGSDVTRPELPDLFGIDGDQVLSGTRERTFSPVRLGRAVVVMQLLRPRTADEG